MAMARTLVTAEDLLKLPRSRDRRYELLDGELIEIAPTGYLHGQIVGRATTKIGGFVEVNQLGDVLGAETGFLLRRNPDRVRAPDVAFVAAGRLPPGPTPTGYVETIPDFVVEVISPSDSASEFQERVDEWLDAGVKVLWAVFPSRSVFIWRSRGQVERRSGNDELDAEPALPGFRWKVSDLFRK